MDILLNLLAIGIGLVGLYFGAEWLVRGSSGVAVRLGITPLVVGLTVVAFGTSAPELVVSLQFNVLADKPAAAVGNVVGSNICNIALVLGLAALIRPIAVSRQVVRREMPVVLAVTAVFVLVLWDGVIGRVEGGFLFAGIILYTVLSVRGALGKNGQEKPVADVPEEPQGSLKSLIGLIVIGLVVLVAGSKFLEVGAVNIATYAGVSDAVIGLTLLAFGTSLPEVATSVVASAKRHGDLITGNVVGSCIFNILMIIGISSLVKPMLVQGINPVDLGFMAGVALLGAVLMLRRTLGRLEGLGFLGVYAYYCYLLAVREGFIA